MKLEKYIHIINEAITDDFCDEILKEYMYSDDWVPGTVNEYEVNQSRKCEAAYISNSSVIDKNPDVRKNIDDKLYNIINSALEKYMKKYNADGYINVKGDTGYILLKYNEGDYVREHVDTYSGEHRTLSCSLLLNDDYDGGELSFFSGTTKPLLNKGDLCIFPSSFTYPHQVTPITCGTRYVIVTWIR